MDFYEKIVTMSEDIAEIKADLKQSISPDRKCKGLICLERIVWTAAGGVALLSFVLSAKGG